MFSGEWTENLRPLSRFPNLEVSLSMVKMHFMNSCVKNREMQVHNVAGVELRPLADLGGGVRDARPPPWASKFFRFHAVFGKIWRVHAPPGGFTPPPSGKSWIRHWRPRIQHSHLSIVGTNMQNADVWISLCNGLFTTAIFTWNEALVYWLDMLRPCTRKGKATCGRNQ